MFFEVGYSGWRKIRFSQNGISDYTLLLNYGDFPIHNIKYKNGFVFFYNDVNVKDGGRQYSKDFFDVTVLKLTETQKDELDDLVKRIELMYFDKDEYNIKMKNKSILDGTTIDNNYIYIDKNGEFFSILNYSKFCDFFESICDFPQYEETVIELDEDTGLLIDDSLYEVNEDDTTIELFDNLIRLLIKSKNEEVELNKPLVNIGETSDCDIKLDFNEASSIHVKISYENGFWYIIDDNSINGIWVNQKN